MTKGTKDNRRESNHNGRPYVQMTVSGRHQPHTEFGAGRRSADSRS